MWIPTDCIQFNGKQLIQKFKEKRAKEIQISNYGKKTAEVSFYNNKKCVLKITSAPPGQVIVYHNPHNLTFNKIRINRFNLMVIHIMGVDYEKNMV